MIELKSSGESEALGEAGRVVAAALAAVRDHASVGVRLDELDDVARSVIVGAGARPSFLDYHPSWAPTPFPGIICTSVNDAVVHGIPNRRRLVEGDLVSIDCGAHLNGWCGDAAVSFIVGDKNPDETDVRLIEATSEALAAGITAARPAPDWVTSHTPSAHSPANAVTD
jgi:methionyl aminopeptidase